MALTDKQEMFFREYVIDLNATQAAILVGNAKD
jgi:phage terminase small subunit